MLTSMTNAITDRGLLAVEIVTVLAAARTEIFTQPTISKMLNVERRYLEPTLQRLVKSGVISSTRGPRGGYRYLGDPKRLMASEIVDVFNPKLDPPPSIIRSYLVAAQVKALAGVSVAKLVEAAFA